MQFDIDAPGGQLPQGLIASMGASSFKLRPRPQGRNDAGDLQGWAFVIADIQKEGEHLKTRPMKNVCKGAKSFPCGRAVEAHSCD